MTFKQYVKWCNNRACDGCWGKMEAMICIDIMRAVEKKPFWKREKFWKTKCEQQVLDEIITPIENKISQAKEGVINET
jgi:hypothetical protein